MMISRTLIKLSVKNTSSLLLKRKDSLSSERLDAFSKRRKTRQLPKPRPSKTRPSVVDSEEERWVMIIRTPRQKERMKQARMMKTLAELLRTMKRVHKRLLRKPLLKRERPSLWTARTWFTSRSWLRPT